MTVLPGCFYGSQMVVDPRDEQLSPEVKELRPGKYTFIVQFCSAGRGLEGFELLWNEVTVVVK